MLISFHLSSSCNTSIPPIPHFRWNFSRADVDGLFSFLSKENFSPIMESHDVNFCWSMLNNAISQLVILLYLLSNLQDITLHHGLVLKFVTGLMNLIPSIVTIIISLPSISTTSYLFVSPKSTILFCSQNLLTRIISCHPLNCVPASYSSILSH